MAVNLRFITITLIMLWKRASTSVAGVTYMDDFDFEQRYRNIHECDPFYWHPLHLPEECADMYERLIRARLPARIPKHAYIPKYPPSQTYDYYQPYHYEYLDNQYYPTIDLDMNTYNQRELTPYEEMLESVQKDVNNLPSVPSVKDMPNFGPVAVYEQAVSRISADMIKKVAMTYARTDDKKEKKGRKKKGGSKWKEIVKKVRNRERHGWKKINNGDIVSFVKS